MRESLLLTFETSELKVISSRLEAKLTPCRANSQATSSLYILVCHSPMTVPPHTKKTKPKSVVFFPVFFPSWFFFFFFFFRISFLSIFLCVLAVSGIQRRQLKKQKLCFLFKTFRRGAELFFLSSNLFVVLQVFSSSRRSFKFDKLLNCQKRESGQPSWKRHHRTVTPKNSSIQPNQVPKWHFRLPL